MHLADYHFLPHEPWFFFVLAILFTALVGLVELGVLTCIYDKMGINRRYVFLLLFLSLLGCYINIPVARLHSQQVRQGIVTYMGRRYVVPVALPAPTPCWPSTSGARHSHAPFPLSADKELALRPRRGGRDRRHRGGPFPGGAGGRDRHQGADLRAAVDRGHGRPGGVRAIMPPRWPISRGPWGRSSGPI